MLFRARKYRINKYALLLALLSLIFSISLSTAEETKLPFKGPGDYKTLPALARIETNKGVFEIKFYRKQAPISVANFKYIVQKGLYNNTIFHSITPGFTIQGGDPTGTGRGGPKWTLPPEMSREIHHQRGAMGWLKMADEVNPERRNIASQFYITLRPMPQIDGFYTVFAQVIRGMENVDRLRVGDRIISVSFPQPNSEDESE